MALAPTSFPRIGFFLEPARFQYFPKIILSRSAA